MAEEEEHVNQMNLQSKKPLNLRRATGIFMILLLLAVGGGYIGYNQVYKPYRMNVQQKNTAQVRAAATSTHVALLQATNQAQEAATASFLTQLQTNYELATSMRPIIDDQMHSPGHYKWDTGTGCAFKKEGYIVTITQKSSFIPCIAKNTRFDNFIYQVKMRIVRGDAGGIAFRANTTSSRAYLFNIGQDGSYSIYYYPGDATKTTQTISSGFSDLIITGQNQDNLVAVSARKNIIDLYINKKYLTSFQDNNLTSGQIGIIANDNQNNTEVVCTQVQVWKL